MTSFFGLVARSEGRLEDGYGNFSGPILEIWGTPSPPGFVSRGNKGLTAELLVSRGNIGVSGKIAAKKRKLEGRMVQNEKCLWMRGVGQAAADSSYPTIAECDTLLNRFII